MYGLHKRLGFMQLMHETPGGAPGGAPAPSATPSPTPQAPASAQGPGQGDWDSTAYRQQYFPNVPDEVWQAHLHEPMGRVNQHVTQLEQRYAPLRGYTPQTVQGLARMAEGFQSNPVGTWIELAQLMQQSGQLDPDIDLDHLAALARGEDPDAGPEPVAPGLDAGNGNLPPEVMQALQQQQQTIQQLQERLDNRDRTDTQRVEDAALNRQLSTLKSTLQKAGYPPEALTDEFLLSQFIAHRGNVQNAVQTATGLRTTLMKGVVPDPAAQPSKDLDLPNGAPKAPRPKKSPPGTGRGMFRDVRASAEQALARANQQ